MNDDVFESFPILETERLVLRAIEERDAGLVYAFNSDLEALRYIARDPYTDLGVAEERLRGFLKDFPERRAIWWAIDERASGETIGYGGLFNIEAEHAKAEVGYGLLQPHWGRGYASEAVELIVAFGLERVGLHRIYGQVDPGNAASARVLEKLGFQLEGTLRDDMFARGRYFDTNLFALVR